MSKEGKPLAGAAKTSFVKKCCEQSAVSKGGKPLYELQKQATSKSALRADSHWNCGAMRKPYCFKYCNTRTLSLLIASCSLRSKKLQSAAHCMASASFPSLAF